MRDEDLPLPRSILFSNIVTAEEYIHVAAAADFHSTEHPAPRRKAAKSMIELDRLAAMQQVSQLGGRVKPTECTLT